MSYIDWLIVIIPTAFIMFMGFFSRRYVTGVSDFLVCGRVAQRYLLTTGDLVASMGLVTIISYCERYYKTGFALSFWNGMVFPLTIMLGLLGYCNYRFRETGAMSMGQFVEMRYSRSLRIFSCFVRTIAEIMANIIMPALAARFFIAFLDLPQQVNIFGWMCPTFMIVVVLTLVLAITLILTAGQLSILITDTIQCLFSMPLVLLVIILALCKFDWSTEIVPVMSDRIPGESFINPFDISGLRDFNLFILIVTFVNAGMHRISGITGASNSAKTAHEGKMAQVLSNWRTILTVVFYIVVAMGIIVVLNHKNYAVEAKEIRSEISRKVSEEMMTDPADQQRFMARINAIPAHNHTVGVDAPLSQKNTLDNPYFAEAEKTFGEISSDKGQASYKTQQFMTIFRQLMFPMTLRNLLPVGVVGLFALLIVLLILSTDDSRIFASSSTLVQDCIVPFCKAEKLSPELHIKLLKWFTVLVGVVYLLGSYFMAQLDYIELFVNIMFGLWLAGCGPMLVFGLYSRFGTTAGAWASLLSGMGLNLVGLICQRTWAPIIYPWLESNGYVAAVGKFLETVSGPFHPWVVWEMSHLKFPISSYEIYFLAMMTSLVVYLVVSALTYKKPFNLDRMLHRGKYNLEGKEIVKRDWSIKGIFGTLIGIDSEYTKTDKAIAWGAFIYAIIWQFFICFLLVCILNAFGLWKESWWGSYFLVVSLIVPAIVAAISTVWFTCGGFTDTVALFRDLAERKKKGVNHLDNGMVDGCMSLADKRELQAVDENKK